MKHKIAVLSGGNSEEKNISQKSVQTILNHLDSNTFEVYHLFIGESWHLESDESIAIDKSDFSVSLKGKKIRFDFVYIMVHGTPGEDGYLQGYFDLLNIPYSSPGHFESTLTFNKWACNHVLRSLGYNCAQSILLKSKNNLNARAIESKLSYPVFVKPNDGGSSYGVTKVSESADLQNAIALAFDHGTEVIIEEEIVGREITNGVLKLNGKTRVLSITEIVTENEFFDFEAKYKGLSKEITPAPLESTIEQKVKTTTESIYNELGLSGIVRVDYIIQNDEPYVLEINTVPGMSEQSIIPQQLREQGLDITQTLTDVILAKLN